jgi:hypothetical protein
VLTALIVGLIWTILELSPKSALLSLTILYYTILVLLDLVCSFAQYFGSHSIKPQFYGMDADFPHLTTFQYWSALIPQMTNFQIYSLNTYKCHKSNIKNLLMKSSESVFIFLSAFYLIIWLMTFSKNLEKISILKIWQLFFFWGVETHFGEK